MDQVFRLFSTPVFKTEITEEIRKKTLDAVVNLKDGGKSVYHLNGWCTPDDLQERPEFEDLSKAILAFAKKTFDHLGMIRNEEYISCMWANVHNVGHQHHQHIHANSILSGVLYLQIPDGSGKTYFVDPREGPRFMHFEYGKDQNEWFQSKNWGIPPKEGLILMFPSWLPHGVEYANKKSDEHRITLSFNIMVHAEANLFTRRLKI